MDTTCREEEHVARLNGIVSQSVTDGIVGNHSCIFVRSDALLQARTEVSLTVVVIDYIPHFSLTHRVVANLCQSIVRVNLDREVIASVDELDEQWEVVAETFVVGSTYQSTLVFFYQFAQVLAGFSTVGHYRFVARNVRDFPAFAYLRLFDVKTLERNNLFATPDGGLQDRIKFKWIHKVIILSYDSV